MLWAPLQVTYLFSLPGEIVNCVMQDGLIISYLLQISRTLDTSFGLKSCHDFLSESIYTDSREYKPGAIRNHP
jgi:hypothetical protein